MCVCIYMYIYIVCVCLFFLKIKKIGIILHKHQIIRGYFLSTELRKKKCLLLSFLPCFPFSLPSFLDFTIFVVIAYLLQIQLLFHKSALLKLLWIKQWVNQSLLSWRLHSNGLQWIIHKDIYDLLDVSFMEKKTHKGKRIFVGILFIYVSQRSLWWGNSSAEIWEKWNTKSWKCLRRKFQKEKIGNAKTLR